MVDYLYEIVKLFHITLGLAVSNLHAITFSNK
jgi:hypothetical protein